MNSVNMIIDKITKEVKSTNVFEVSLTSEDYYTLYEEVMSNLPRPPSPPIKYTSYSVGWFHMSERVEYDLNNKEYLDALDLYNKKFNNIIYSDHLTVMTYLGPVLVNKIQ